MAASRCTSEQTRRRIKITADSIFDPNTKATHHDFYQYLEDLSNEKNARWTYRDVAEITGISESVLRMRMRDRRQAKVSR